MQKQLNDTVLKEFIYPAIVELTAAKPNQDTFDLPASSIPPPIPELSIPNIVEPAPPDEPFIPPPITDSPPPPYEPSPPYDGPPTCIPLEDIFIDDETVYQPKIGLVPKTDEADGNVVEIPSDDKVEIKKSLNNTDVQIKTESVQR